MAPQPLKPSGRIPELDGIRGVAILLVLLWHYIYPLVPVTHTRVGHLLKASLGICWSGVDLFFVLSGFLIGGILLDARESPRYFQTFYIRRACRIIPIYCVDCLLLTAFLLFPVLDPLIFAKPMPWWSYATYTQNFWMAVRGTFGGAGMGVTWSLAVEEQFYLTLPLVIRYARSGLKYALFAGILAAPILRIPLRSGDPTKWLAGYVLMPCRADSLLMGVVCALLTRDLRARNFLVSRSRLLWAAFVVLSGGTAWLALRHPETESLQMETLGYTWLALLYACLLLLTVSQPHSFVSQIFRIPALRWLGSIAYGVYLFHLWALALCMGFLRGQAWPYEIRSSADLAAVGLALVLTLGICQLSWTYFEKRVVQLGHRFRYD